MRIVLASPSDVVAERDIAEAVAQELNCDLGSNLEVLIEILRWEHLPPALHKAGAQGYIDEAFQIPHSDILLGIFWKHFGRGAEHEIRQAISSWKNTGRPDIMLYFRQVDEIAKDQGEDVASVGLFKEEMWQQGLCQAYANLQDFRKMIRAHLIDKAFQHRASIQLSAAPTLREVFAAVTATAATLRSAGVTERVGDIVVTLWTPIDSVSSELNLTIVVNTNVTNRLGPGSTVPEVQLLKPAVAGQPSGIFAIGTLVAANKISFPSLPLTVRQAAPVILRISGIRVNAAQLGLSERASTQVVAFTLLESMDGTVGFRCLNPQITVGLSLPDFVFHLRSKSDGVFKAPEFRSAAFVAPGQESPKSCKPEDLSFLLQFRGLFPGAFAAKNDGHGNTAVHLVVTFSDLPNGCDLYVTAYNTTIGSTVPPTSPIRAAIVETEGLSATDSNYDGVMLPLRKVEQADDSATIAWQMVGDDAASHLFAETMSFGVLVLCQPNAVPGLCEVRAAIGPLTTIGTASPDAPIPRFFDSSVTLPAFSVV